MEIKLNPNVGPVPTAVGSAGKPRVTSAEQDGVEFVGSEALNRELANTPAVRPEMVARARELIADVQYPPSETIRRIASLLAFHIRAEKE